MKNLSGNAVAKSRQTENYLSFVEKGVMRFYIEIEETEPTFDFAFENAFASAYDSFLFLWHSDCILISKINSTTMEKQQTSSTPSGHNIVSAEAWLTARKELLEAEKVLTRQSDEVARKRQALPWVKVEKDYLLNTSEGKIPLTSLFKGRSQLLIYHFMFGPDYTAGCPHCSAIADGFDGCWQHLAAHDVMLWAVSRAPLEKLLSFEKRMGWTFPWASSHDSDFNYDFNASFTEEQQRTGELNYNYAGGNVKSKDSKIEKTDTVSETGSIIAATVGEDWAAYSREAPGMSAFALENGILYHTYSAYARGLDALWGVYQWLDRTPLGRNEKGFWMKRHDEYGNQPTGDADKKSCCQ